MEIYDLADQFRAALLQKERAAAVRLVRAYGQAWQRLQANLDAVTRQIESARTAGEEVNAEWLRRQKRYRDLLDQVAAEIAKFAEVVGREITKEQRAAVRAAQKDAQRLLLASTGDVPEVELTFNRLPADAAENLIGFLGDGSPLADLLGELAPAARKGVETALVNGVTLGHGARKIAGEIKVALGGNLTRALRIARTETLRAHREASHQTYQQNQEILEGWVWNAALNERCCVACVAMHGTFHPVEERMATHVNCRCAAIPRSKSWAELGFPDLPETRPPIQSGIDWFEKQPESAQRAIFDSPGSFEAWKKGELKLQDFVGRRESAAWGASYYQLSLGPAKKGLGRWPGPGAPPPPPTPAPVPAPPDPAPAVDAGPAGKPIAPALKFPSRGKLRDAGRRALDAIAKVHGDGELPELPVEREPQPWKQHGGYYLSQDLKPRRITTTPSGDHPELTLVHEIGHFLDHQGVTGKVRDQYGFASSVDPRFEKLRTVIRESNASQELLRLSKLREVEIELADGRTIDYPIDRGYIRYLFLPHELWARAYSQYVALRSGDPTLKAQLDRLRRRGPLYYPVQWDDDDFEPIAKAIDELMVELGWRK